MVREYEETFWDDGNNLYHDCGGSFTTICICQN